MVIITRNSYNLIERGHMLLMGHRGAKGELPENTLLGFQRAIDLQLPAVELDIHLSADGKIVVIHDDTVDRTTDGKGRVNDLSFSDLQKLDAGHKQKIPLLTESLDLLLGSGLEVQIEIKDGKTLSGLKNIYRELSSQKKELITVISFHHGYIKDMKDSFPSLRTAALLYGRPLNSVEIAKSCLADGLSFNIGFIDPEVREQTRNAGMTLTGWNANCSEDFEKMVDLELDYLGTDVPSEMLSLIHKVGC